eukprot:4109375-Amphidinium_carterae.4
MLPDEPHSARELARHLYIRRSHELKGYGLTPDCLSWPACTMCRVQGKNCGTNACGSTRQGSTGRGRAQDCRETIL